MRIDADELYHRIARAWYNWAEDHGQVPVWPPRHGSQTHHMAVTATNAAIDLAQQAEREVLEDVATFARAQQKRLRGKTTKEVLEALATALEDGTWEDL